MKLISALLQESITGLFTNSIKDMDTSDYEIFKKAIKMMGVQFTSQDNAEIGMIDNMQYFKFTPSLKSPEYGHFAFDNIALLDLVRGSLNANTSLRRMAGKEFNISPESKDFERQILIAANNNAVDIIRRLGYHKEITL